MNPMLRSRVAAHGFVACIALAAFGCAAPSTGDSGDAPTPEGPARFTYAPFDITYRIASHTRQDQDFGGQVNTTQYALFWHLSAVNDPPSLTYTIDSTPTVTGTNQGIDAGDLRAAAGAVYRGTLFPDGRVEQFTGGDDTNDFLQQLSQSLERFLPRVPPDGAVPGQSWVDTLETTTTSGGLEIRVVLITRSEAEAWASHEDRQVLPLSLVTEYTLTGTGTQLGTEIDLEGNGVRRGTLYLGDGTFLGGVSADTANMTATVVAMGSVIPVMQVRHDTVTVVRRRR